MSSNFAPSLSEASRRLKHSPLPIDDELKRLGMRGWLKVSAPTKLVRDAIILAIDRGHQLASAVQQQDDSLREWKRKSRLVATAARSLDQATRSLSETTCWQLMSKDIRTEPKMSLSKARVVHQRLIRSVVDLNQLASASNEMVRGLSKLKVNPGDPFLRGFVFEMMVTWTKLTRTRPSSKRDACYNPFVSFADAALHSIRPEMGDRSCVGFVPTAMAEFNKMYPDGDLDFDD